MSASARAKRNAAARDATETVADKWAVVPCDSKPAPVLLKDTHIIDFLRTCRQRGWMRCECGRGIYRASGLSGARATRVAATSEVARATDRHTRLLLRVVQSSWLPTLRHPATERQRSAQTHASWDKTYREEPCVWCGVPLVHSAKLSPWGRDHLHGTGSCMRSLRRAVRTLCCIAALPDHVLLFLPNTSGWMRTVDERRAWNLFLLMLLDLETPPCDVCESPPQSSDNRPSPNTTVRGSIIPLQEQLRRAISRVCEDEQVSDIQLYRSSDNVGSEDSDSGGSDKDSDRESDSEDSDRDGEDSDGDESGEAVGGRGDDARVDVDFSVQKQIARVMKSTACQTMPRIPIEAKTATAEVATGTETAAVEASAVAVETEPEPVEAATGTETAAVEASEAAPSVRDAASTNSVETDDATAALTAARDPLTAQSIMFRTLGVAPTAGDIEWLKQFTAHV